MQFLHGVSLLRKREKEKDRRRNESSVCLILFFFFPFFSVLVNNICYKVMETFFSLTQTRSYISSIFFPLSTIEKKRSRKQKQNVLVRTLTYLKLQNNNNKNKTSFSLLLLLHLSQIFFIYSYCRDLVMSSSLYSTTTIIHNNLVVQYMI